MRDQMTERELKIAIDKINKGVISINTGIDRNTMERAKELQYCTDSLSLFVFRDNLSYFGCVLNESPHVEEYDSSKVLGLHWGPTGTLTIGHVTKGMKGVVYGLGKYQVLQILQELQSDIALEAELDQWDEYELLGTS